LLRLQITSTMKSYFVSLFKGFEISFMQNNSDVSMGKPRFHLSEEQSALENKSRVASFVSSVSQLPDEAIAAVIDHVMTQPLAVQGRFVERCATMLRGLQDRYAFKD
jgi:hypothetical protein